MVNVHYELYDGHPLLSKWVSITSKVRISMPALAMLKSLVRVTNVNTNYRCHIILSLLDNL